MENLNLTLFIHFSGPALSEYIKGTLCAGKSKDGNWYLQQHHLLELIP